MIAIRSDKQRIPGRQRQIIPRAPTFDFIAEIPAYQTAFPKRANSNGACTRVPASLGSLSRMRGYFGARINCVADPKGLVRHIAIRRALGYAG